MLLRTLVAVFLLVPSWLTALDDTGHLMTDEDVARGLGQYKKNRDLRPEASLLEPSKVLILPHLLLRSGGTTLGSRDLAIEVEFNETFFPYQNPPSATDRHFGGWIAKVGITPMYRVRIWKERSAPVRVPSFMPKGTIHLEYSSSREQGLQWGETFKDHRIAAKAIVLHTIMLTPLGHHSNGQDGCLFADSTGIGFPTEECPSSPPPDSIRINRLNGSFSTNYAEASYFYRRLMLAPLDLRYDVASSVPGLWDGERRAKYSWFAGATYQFNYPVDLAGGALEKPVRPIYGMNRLRVTAGFEKHWVETGAPEPRLWHRLYQRFTENAFKGRVWLEVTDKKANAADCVASGPPGQQPACAPKVSWGVDFTVGLLSKADGLGLYTRFLHAQDYYNLSFSQRKDNRFQAGLSFSLSRGRGLAFPVLNQMVLKNELASTLSWAEYRRRVKRLSKMGSGGSPSAPIHSTGRTEAP